MREDHFVWTAEQVLDPLERWEHNCHAASVQLVRSGRFGVCRVVRGACEGVPGQHSWVILGDDCYDDRATIIDPTLWSYDDRELGIWTGTYRDGLHTPHGKGSIWNWGRPDRATGPVVKLTPRKPFSQSARNFLDMLGPLDQHGWITLAHAPMQGWPAGEIIDAMCEDKSLRAYIPIDIVGMLTDRNPGGMYLPETQKDSAIS
jgi:hypothetical protein